MAELDAAGPQPKQPDRLVTREYQGGPAIHRLACRFDVLGGDAACHRVLVEYQQYSGQRVHDVVHAKRDGLAYRDAKP